MGEKQTSLNPEFLPGGATAWMVMTTNRENT